MSAFDDMTENMKVKILKDTIEKLEKEKEKLETQNFELEAKVTQLTKMSIEQVGRYLEKDLEIKELKKQVTRKTNLHNKTSKRLSRSRMESRAQKAIADYRGDALEKQEHEIDLLKVRLESSKRNSEDLQKCLDDSRMVADGWKKQFEMLEEKVRSTALGENINWKLSAQHWRTNHSKLLEEFTKSEQLHRKTARRLQIARAMQKHQSDQKVFFTRLNRAAGNRIYRLEKELEVERNRAAELPVTREALLLNIKLVQSLGEELEMERDRLADAVKQIKQLELENEDAKNFKRLESSYDDLHDRYKEAVAQLEHEESLKSYSDAYIKDLELTQCHLRQEVKNYKEDVLHVVRVSRKG